MSTAESCSAKFYKGKKLITAEMKLHGWFYTKPPFENSFQDLKKYSADLKASCRLETIENTDT